MNKIYCVNCKYFNGVSTHTFPSDWVTCKRKVYFTDDWDSKRKKYRGSPCEKNRNNNCEDYKRKWWKFGV